MTVIRLSDRQAWAVDVATSLAALAERPSAVLGLLYFEHLTEHEVAARLGITVDHARAAAAAGMRQLGNLLMEV